MKLTAYDPGPAFNDEILRVELDELLRTAEVVGLHCPLTPPDERSHRQETPWLS